MNDMFRNFAPKELRPHQAEAINLIRSSLGKGNRRVVCQGPTGFGKTLVAAKIIQSAQAKGNRVIFTAPAISLIDQTVSAFESEGLDGIGVMQANHPRTDRNAKLQVASVQTLARREIPDAALVIVDECFVAGTLVAMADGTEKPISDIRLNDAVLTAVGPGRVHAISAKRTNETYVVEFDDGQSIECTGSHPIFTDQGWVDARALEDGASVVGIEGMPGLWRGVWPGSVKRKGDGRTGVGRTSDLFEVLLQETEQPIVAAGSGGKSVADIAAYWSPTKNSGRERVGHDGTAGGAASRAGGGVDGGACGQRVEGDTAARGSGALQAGYCEQVSDDCHRSGRREPLPDGAASAGPQEGRLFGWRRVVSVSRAERPCLVAVFNLQVSGHPSYFAGGRLVHNCHIRSEAVEKLMDERPDVFFVGLSATPWARGMGLRWQDLVIPVTIGELIDAGFLSRFTAFAPDVPDLSGVKTLAGDYAEDALADLMGDAKLVGSVVDTWLEHGGDRPSLCFAVNRAHAAQLKRQFERAGVAAGYVDAHTDIVERQRLNHQFRDGAVRVICSVRTMTTGVDLPVSCIIDAAPTKSEILHVQKIGRGLRVNPGTEDCLILDHAGNSLRLGLVTDIGRSALDSTPPGEKQERKAKAEKLPNPCAACGTLHTGLTCPACGKERKPVSGVDEADGALVEITGRKVAPTMADKQRFYSMALHLDRERARGGKLAKGLYRGRFDVWPRGLLEVPVPPDAAFMNYERSRRIAFAKRMEAQRGAN